MPESTPKPMRHQLEDRVLIAFESKGIPHRSAMRMTAKAVDNYYNGKLDDHHQLVAYEATQLFLAIIPPFATHLRAAWESIAASMGSMAAVAQDAMTMMAKAKQPDFSLAPPPPVVSIDLGDGEGWQEVPGIKSVEIDTSTLADDDSIVVIEVQLNEFHLSAARALRKLNCSYPELADMAERRDFKDAHHQVLWVSIGDTVDRARLAKAEYLLELVQEDAFGPELTEDDLAKLDVEHPHDVLTGAPAHLVINGDHEACGCGGHQVSCQIWNVPFWKHAASVCHITRTLCNDTPKHTYGEPCADYHEAP